MSIFNIFGQYNDAWKAIVLPPRQDYSIYDLGPNELVVKNNKIKRTDFRLLNKRGQTVECSYFQQAGIEEAVPCVVYLHANGCSRLEALQYLDTILSSPMSFFCFDFSGCGKSGGLYTSLGWYEQDDLECVIQYLTNTGKVSKIAVWGRSMGAITAILYAQKDPRVCCYIFDSPFSKFKQLVKELAKEKASLPGFLSEGAFGIIRQTIKSKVGFDIDALRPLKYVDKIKVPALFGAAKDDKFVLPQHTSDLYHAYAGYKQIMMFEGDHNSTRPVNWMLKAKEFLKIYLLGEVNPADNEPRSFKHLFDPIVDKTSTPITEVKLNSGKKAKHGSIHDRKVPLHANMNFNWLEHSISTPNLQGSQDLKTTERDIKGPSFNHQDPTNHSHHAKPHHFEKKLSDIFSDPKKNQAPNLHRTYTIDLSQKPGTKNAQSFMYDKNTMNNSQSQSNLHISSQVKFAKHFSNPGTQSSSSISIFGPKQIKSRHEGSTVALSYQSTDFTLKDNSLHRLNSSIGFGVDQSNQNNQNNAFDPFTKQNDNPRYISPASQFSMSLTSPLSNSVSLCESKISPEKANSGRIFDSKKAFNPYHVDTLHTAHPASDKTDLHRAKENLVNANLPKKPTILQKVHSDNSYQNSGLDTFNEANHLTQSVVNSRQIEGRRNTDNIIKPFANFMKAEEPKENKEKNVVNKSVVVENKSKYSNAPQYPGKGMINPNRITVDLSHAGLRYVKNK